MVREAAVLDVPAYSYFRGRAGRVDEWLEQEGRLVLFRSTEDVREKLVVSRRQSHRPYQLNDAIVPEICAHIIGVAGA